MIKFISILIFIVVSLLAAPVSLAVDSSFISIVNPVRGSDFWDSKDQQPETAVRGEVDILKQFNLSATWLIRFDALVSQDIISILHAVAHEKGIFLEITPSLTKAAGVKYQKSQSWHNAASAFLTGYERGDREKLIDAVFEKFKNVFGYYPESVGAWWIDAYSLSYMQKKYGITAGLVVADQYSTDNYQIWGQYFSTPYYPSKKDALNPAQSLDSKLPVVLMQWAARDPVNAYGNGVEESTFSVQANDYLDYHNLDTNYFSKLIDIYTKQPFNKFGHLVVGLENSYSWNKYGEEYRRQIEALVDKKNSGELTIIPMKDFASWYKSTFPQLSPAQVLLADDPLKQNKKVIWFMNPHYRAGLFISKEGSIFRDIRQYVEGEEEICYVKACKEVNFATFATRVLDDVTYGHKLVLDDGKINNLSFLRLDDNFTLSYVSEAGKLRKIEFLPRDIAIDGKISSIDGLILQATSKSFPSSEINFQKLTGSFKGSTMELIFDAVKFLLFMSFAVFIPGYILSRKILKVSSLTLSIFLSLSLGLITLTIIGLVAGILKIWWLLFVYILIVSFLFLRFRLDRTIKFSSPKKPQILVSLLIVAGSIFQFLPVFKSGLIYDFGMGFWGPNAHDGIWHLSLINQLIKGIPPQNPILSGINLKNYHYFYDLLLAITHLVTKIAVSDLLFRFYPLLLSLMLGMGTFCLLNYLSKSKVAIFLGLYFVYFTGSFGWIVEFLRERHFGGESAFWVNQPVSFNLNPPFAISLVLTVAIFHLLMLFLKRKDFKVLLLLSLVVGSLVGFKTYDSILILGSLFILGIITLLFNKDFSIVKIFFGSTIFSLALLIPNQQLGQLLQGPSKLFIWSPFWFIHSMIDSPDRVGWVRLSLARVTALMQGNWIKFILAESLGLLLFIIGNLGVRILGFGMLWKSKVLFKTPIYLFMLILSVLSASIPLFLIQTGNPWNTIQFFYYVLYISSIATALTCDWIYTKVSKLTWAILLVVIVSIAPINAWVTARSYLYPSPHALITNDELKALNFLAKQNDKVVLTYPYDKNMRNSLSEPLPIFAYETTAYVAAFSNKATYVSDEIQNDILQDSDGLYKKRLIESKQFFSDRDSGWQKQFLSSSNIGYVYLPKLFKININTENLNLKSIYENSEIEIFETIK